MLAVILPSRGLVHSRTMADVVSELKGYDYELFMAHGLPIPECFNVPLEQALNGSYEHFLFIEDDMQLPKGIIDELFHTHADIVTADYPVRHKMSTILYLDDRFQYGGTGCTLVHRKVFEKLGKPYFRTGTSYQIEDNQLKPGPSLGGAHGHHEIDFYQRAIKAGFEIKVINQQAGQYFLKKPELPKYGNESASQYEIETWTL